MKHPATDNEASSVKTMPTVNRIGLVLAVLAVLAGVVYCVVPAAGHEEGAVAPVSGVALPEGYRDWRLVSVAHEAGELEDLRAILGNDAAIDAYRKNELPFPDGTIIARIAWSYDASEENNRLFGREQSFVAGAPKNGVQLMVKDSKRYASTGGWGFAQFNEGKPVSESMLASCFPCHAAMPARDLVFTRYSP